LTLGYKIVDNKIAVQHPLGWIRKLVTHYLEATTS